MQSLADLVKDGNVHVHFILGPPGCGKSELLRSTMAILDRTDCLHLAHSAAIAGSVGADTIAQGMWRNAFDFHTERYESSTAFNAIGRRKYFFLDEVQAWAPTILAEVLLMLTRANVQVRCHAPAVAQPLLGLAATWPRSSSLYWKRCAVQAGIARPAGCAHWGPQKLVVACDPNQGSGFESLVCRVGEDAVVDVHQVPPKPLWLWPAWRLPGGAALRGRFIQLHGTHRFRGALADILHRGCACSSLCRHTCLSCAPHRGCPYSQILHLVGCADTTSPCSNSGGRAACPCTTWRRLSVASCRSTGGSRAIQASFGLRVSVGLRPRLMSRLFPCPLPRLSPAPWLRRAIFTRRSSSSLTFRVCVVSPRAGSATSAQSATARLATSAGAQIHADPTVVAN